MRHSQFLRLVAVVLAGVLLGSASAIGAALGQTAKALLPRALEAALKWQADAALHGITSSSVGLNGTAPGANAYGGQGPLGRVTTPPRSSRTVSSAVR